MRDSYLFRRYKYYITIMRQRDIQPSIYRITSISIIHGKHSHSIAT